MRKSENTWFGIPRNQIDWFPTIDYEKCIGCMACVKKCSHGVYAEKDGWPDVIKPKNCIVGCIGCEPVCPQHAISHPPKSYLEKISRRNNVEIKCKCGGK